jgi:hypothetical protein
MYITTRVAPRSLNAAVGGRGELLLSLPRDIATTAGGM